MAAKLTQSKYDTPTYNQKINQSVHPFFYVTDNQSIVHPVNHQTMVDRVNTDSALKGLTTKYNRSFDPHLKINTLLSEQRYLCAPKAQRSRCS